MKLDLEVLAASSIKRKKPWPRMAWLGKVQESIFLIDDHRLSVLYVPSGKTRRRVPKLQPILKDITAINHSDNGQFIVGLLRSGDVFLWHKDTDRLKYVQGLPELAQCLPNTSNNTNQAYLPGDAPSPFVYVADDGSKLAVLVNRTRLFIWEQDNDQTIFGAKHTDIKGSWTEVKPSRAVSYPDPSTCEISVSIVFCIDDVLGFSCRCSMVFTVDDSVCVTTAVVRRYEEGHVLSYSTPTFNVEWTDIKYSLADLIPGGLPMRLAGAYICQASHDGQLLAVAVNQKKASLNRMMFLSPLTKTSILSDLHGMGSRLPCTRAYRMYWVTDLAWTADDLFTIIMTRQGSVAILARLGEPVLLQTFGCCLDISPRLYLPLHPLIHIKTAAPQEEASPFTTDEVDHEGQAAADRDPLRQRFSICCHPRLPIFLCSDGYMVTALQLPTDLSCLALMKGLLMESNHHLQRVQEHQKSKFTVAGSTQRNGNNMSKLSCTDTVAGSNYCLQNNVHRGLNEPYHFEEPEEDALNHSIDEDIEEAGSFNVMSSPIRNMDSGKLFFGDFEALNTSSVADPDMLVLDGENLTVVQLLERTRKTLLLAWSLGASHCGSWTAEHEDVINNVVHTLLHFFALIMQSSDDIIHELHMNSSDDVHKKISRVEIVIRVIVRVIDLLKLDATHQHLMVSAIRFVKYAIKLLLTAAHLYQFEQRLVTLHGCFNLLGCLSHALCGIYTLIPHMAVVNDMFASVHKAVESVHEPPVLCEYQCIKGQYGVNLATDIKPRYELSGAPPEQRKLIRPLPEEEVRSGIMCSMSEINKRLSPTWRLLYKQSVRLYKATVRLKTRAKLRKCAYALLVALQVKLTSVGQGHKVAPIRKYKVQPGCRLSIEGCSVPALKAWLYQLNMPNESSRGVGGTVARLFLSTLYSLLLQNELRAAIELTEVLLRQPNISSAAATCQQDQSKKLAMLAELQKDTGSSNPPQYIQNGAVRAVVRSMARIMVAYFSNSTLFVYPPHAPRIIPPLHWNYTNKHRVIPLYHEALANIIRQDGLGEIWTVERAADYLLLSGLLAEAAWFANTLGDWKTTFIIGVAQNEHRTVLPYPYKRHKRKLALPMALLPDRVLQSRLAHNFGLKTNLKGGLLLNEETDLSALGRVLSDLMLAAVLSRVDLVPWLLEGLVTRLRTVTSNFSAIVPAGIYLPAPPVYCPQPANTSKDQLNEKDGYEVTLRYEASSLIQLVFLVLEGASCTLPAARWYAQRVNEAVIKGRQFKPIEMTLENGPDVPFLCKSFIDTPASSFSGHEDDPSVHSILTTLRDFCSLVWLLYARDKLSGSLRKKLQLAENKVKKRPVPPDVWLKHCRESLHWAACLMPFSRFLGAQGDIFGITLSLITELPPDENTCQLLCQFFYDVESLDPELQDKMQTVLKDWQMVFIKPSCTSAVGSRRSPRDPNKSPRGTSLSVYFHKQTRQMKKHFQRKAKVFGEYEEFVFDPESEQKKEGTSFTVSGLSFIGSRPFESQEPYLEFLDLFYAVSFHKCLEIEEKQGVTPIPLLLAGTDALRQKELMSFSHKAVTSLYRKQQISQTANLPQASVNDFLSGKATSSPQMLPGPPTSSPHGKVGLFRSSSFSEFYSKPRQSAVSPLTHYTKKSCSHQDLRMLSAEEEIIEVHTSRPWLRRERSKTPYDPSSYAQSRPISGSDTQLSVDKNVMFKRTLAQGSVVRRSSSVNDVGNTRKDHGQIKSRPGCESKTAKPFLKDPLLRPSIPVKMLERLKFGERFSELEQLLEWLTRWAGRNHTLNARSEHHLKDGTNVVSDSLPILNRTHEAMHIKNLTLTANLIDLPSSNQVENHKPIMRIKIHPRMILYSLWLVERQYYSKQCPHSAQEEPLEPTRENNLPASHQSSTMSPSLPLNRTSICPNGIMAEENLIKTDQGPSSRHTADTPQQEGHRTVSSVLERRDEGLGQEKLEEASHPKLNLAESSEILSDEVNRECKRKKAGTPRKKLKNDMKKNSEKKGTLVEDEKMAIVRDR